MNLERILSARGKIRDAAVGIARNPDGKSLHACLWYRDGDRRIKYIHMTLFLAERRQYPSKNEYFDGLAFRFVDPPLADIELAQLAAFCDSVVNLGDVRLVYGLKFHPDAKFDLTSGLAHFPSGSRGFTCVTFVLALFKSVGIDVIDFQNWPEPDDSDKQAQKAAVSLLANCKGVDPKLRRQLLKELESEIGATRIRPEDLAGANLEQFPASNSLARPAGKEFLKVLPPHPRTPRSSTNT